MLDVGVFDRRHDTRDGVDFTTVMSDVKDGLYNRLKDEIRGFQRAFGNITGYVEVVDPYRLVPHSLFIVVDRRIDFVKLILMGGKLAVYTL